VRTASTDVEGAITDNGMTGGTFKVEFSAVEVEVVGKKDPVDGMIDRIACDVAVDVAVNVAVDVATGVAVDGSYTVKVDSDSA
jgi:hypothetical protein